MSESINESANPRSAGFCCALIIVLAGGATSLTVVAGWFVVTWAFTDFERHRDTMCIRDDLVVTNEHCRYSPGFDDAMWCRFTVESKGIDEVFDASRVDTTQFNQADYRFRVDWITDDWWDVYGQSLTGGEVEIDGDLMRVAFVGNGDGTLTVYVFWFEV